MGSLTFRVTGEPGAQGSKRHVGNGRMVESSKKVAPWRQDVVAAAQKAAEEANWNPPPAAIEATLVFWFRRPKSHYRTGRHSDELRPDAPFLHSQKPDSDKLARSTLDALTTSGVIPDDCRISDLAVRKRWTGAGTSGAAITIRDRPRHEEPA